MALVEADAEYSSWDPALQDDELVSVERASSLRWSPKAPSRSVGRLLPHSIYPIWQLGDLQLSRPIVVTIEHGEGQVVISSASLHVWGAGDETYAALQDFQQTFRDVLDSYEHTPEHQMSRDAKQYLEQLRSYLPKA